MTKRRSVLAWAAIDHGPNLPWPELVTEHETKADLWREVGHEVVRVRITVVEPKPKRRGKGKNKGKVKR